MHKIGGHYSYFADEKGACEDSTTHSRARSYDLVKPGCEFKLSEFLNFTFLFLKFVYQINKIVFRRTKLVVCNPRSMTQEDIQEPHYSQSIGNISPLGTDD